MKIDPTSILTLVLHSAKPILDSPLALTPFLNPNRIVFRV